MKKNIFKKIFIKFSKLLGFEIIDQNEFNSPTLNKELNEELSNIKKSIVLPLGEVKLTRKIQSLSIIFRTNTNICLLYTSPSPRDATLSRMPSSA